jgi:hypothetical protein
MFDSTVIQLYAWIQVCLHAMPAVVDKSILHSASACSCALVVLQPLFKASHAGGLLECEGK